MLILLSERKCGICCVKYSTELKPYLISCGHTLCESCAKEEKFQCPMDCLAKTATERIISCWSILLMKFLNPHVKLVISIIISPRICRWFSQNVVIIFIVNDALINHHQEVGIMSNAQFVIKVLEELLSTILC